MLPTTSATHGCRNANSWHAVHLTVRASNVRQPGPVARQQANALASSTAIAASNVDAEISQRPVRQAQQADADQEAPQARQHQPRPLPPSAPPPPTQQQQRQQQPRIVLTPLHNPAAAPGSISQSSPLGSWSAAGPYDPAGGPAPGRLRAGGPRDLKQEMMRAAGRKRRQKRGHNPVTSTPDWLQRKGRQLTAYISSANSISNLLHMVSSSQSSNAFNIAHIATAYKMLAFLHLNWATPPQGRRRPWRPQQQLQQQLPAQAEPVDEVLLLLDGLTASHLADAAVTDGSPASATAQLDEGSSSSSSLGSTAGLRQPPVHFKVRALAGIINQCARLEHKLPWETLLLLLQDFLHEADVQQRTALQQLERDADQQTDVSTQQGLQAPQMQQDLQQARLQPEAYEGQLRQAAQFDSSFISSDSAVGGDSQQAICQALSLLCWGLSKLGFTTCNVYELSSEGNEAVQQQRLQEQRLYWQRLANLAVRVMPHGSPRDVSTLCYAFAAGGYQDAALWGRLGQQVVASLNSFTPQEFSQTLWAFATADAAYRPLLREAGSVAQQLAPGFTAQGLANVLWAMVTLTGSAPPQLLAATEEVCLRRDLDRFGSVNLAMLVSVHARMGRMRVELGAAINQSVLRTLSSFSPENLCRLVAGLASLHCLQLPLMEAVSAKLLKHLQAGTLDVQYACFGVWGLALADPAMALPLLPAMLHLASRHVHMVARSSDATAKLCSALAMTRYRDDAFMGRLANCLAGGAASVPADMSQAELEASTHADGTTTPAAGAAAGAASGTAFVARWQHKSAAQHMVTVATSLARLGFSQHTPLLQLLLQQYVERVEVAGNHLHHPSSSSSAGSGAHRLSTFLQQQVVALLWAAAVLDMREPVRLLRSLLRLMHGAVDLPTVSMAQLVQVHMWLQTLDPAGRAVAALMPQGLLKSSLTVWRQQLVPAVVQSELHKEVLGQLAALKLQPVAEARTADGMFSVDIVVNFKGCSVAVEVLGPDHYTSNMVVPPSGLLRQQQSQQQQGTPQTEQQQQQHVLLGPELLRFRLLGARGLALAAVSSFEAAGAVSTLKGAHALRQLLQHKLTEAVDLHMQAQQQQQQQAAALQARKGGKQQPATAAAGKRRQRVSQAQMETGAQPVQQVSAAGDSQLSQLVLQPGFSEVQQRMRRTRAVHRQQRQQQREHRRTKELQQEALQTLLTAAVARDSAALDAAGDDDGVGGLTDLSDPFQGLVVDAEFDLPLDLDALAPPEQRR